MHTRDKSHVPKSIVTTRFIPCILVDYVFKPLQYNEANYQGSNEGC